MRICKNCGVELDEDMEVCPLCNEGEISDSSKKTIIYPSDAVDFAKKDSRKYAWELSGIITFSGVIISIIIDLLFGKGLNWSLYSVTALLYVWSAISTFFLAIKKPLILFPALLLLTLCLELIFDLIDKPTWFLSIALPITVTFFILVGLVIVAHKSVKHKGFNILAFILIAFCVLCIVSELFIDLAIFKSIQIKWSAIVSAALIPVALVLLFLHYRLERGRRLDSFFHV